MVDLTSPKSLNDWIFDGEELALIDVREAGQFGEGHLLFAVPIAFSELENRIHKMVPRKDTRIVLCAEAGSEVIDRAAACLQDLGYGHIAILDGGVEAWSEAGFTLFKGVFVPSKLFGEMVEEVYHTPHISAQELKDLQDRDANILLLDGRPKSEFKAMTLPGSTCCPNAELPRRLHQLTSDPDTMVVVHCAGRTRSILGAQTLINFGVSQNVVALENGTQGWALIDLPWQHGATAFYPEIDDGDLEGQRAQARAMVENLPVPFLSADDAERLLSSQEQSHFVLDVRTPEEFKLGSLSGAQHAEGGQLIQSTDRYVGVRHGKIYLWDNEELVRAPVVAHWLAQMGHDVSVLTQAPRLSVAQIEAQKHHVEPISIAALRSMQEARENLVVLDLRPSMDHIQDAIPGSIWITRAHLHIHLESLQKNKQVILVGDDDKVALVAGDLQKSGLSCAQLQGGMQAWAEAGLATQPNPSQLTDKDCIDYLFFVHDRHQGNKDAMRAYLSWELGLIAQASEQELQSYPLWQLKNNLSTS